MSARRVLILRAAEDGPALATALLARGLTPVPLPLLEYDPGPNLALVEQRVEALSKGSWIVLTSPRAAASLPASASLPPGVRIAAVGPSTAAALKKTGHAVHLVPRGAGAAGLLEALSEETENSKPSRVLWLAGDRALPDLEKGLRGSGHEVERLVVYCTILRKPEPAEVEPALENLAAFCCTSPSTVRALCDVAPAPWLAEAREHILAAAIGRTTEESLKQHGFQHRLVAPRPSLIALAEALARVL